MPGLKHNALKILVISSVIFFIALVLFPAIGGYAILFPRALEATHEDLLAAGAAVMNSLWIASLVTSIDLLTGIPLAFYITRKRDSLLSRGIDAILDAPLFVPTAVLGFSVLSLWSMGELSFNLISPGALLIILLHFTFTYPYIVRTLVGIIDSTDLSPEIVARSMGITGFPLYRTVTLPMIKQGIVAAALMSFARSISETGATFVVAGNFMTGPVFIKVSGDSPAASLAVILLIAISLGIYAGVRMVARKISLPLYPVTRVERKAGKRTGTGITILSLVFLFVMVLLPAFYLVAYSTPAPVEWGDLLYSMWISISIAGIVTIIGIVMGIPLSHYLARGNGKIQEILMSLVMVPLIVPTVALGTSLRVFWKLVGISGYGAVVLAHLSFTFPLFVQGYVAAIESVPPSLEETAMSLGSSPAGAFRDITLPLTMPGVAAGSVLVFTRSFGETGATTAVSTDVQTVPLLLVSWIKKAREGMMSMSTIALASLLVLIVGTILMLMIKIIGRRGERNA